MKTEIITYKGKKIEINVTDEQKGKSFEEIEIPKGWKLWTSQMCIDLHNDKKLRKELNLEDCWFWIEQPFKLNKEKNLGAGFGALSGRANLNCNRVPAYWISKLGVRFYKDC